MVRASACHAEGRGSEPRHSRQLKKPLEIQRFFCVLNPVGSEPRLFYFFLSDLFQVDLHKKTSLENSPDNQAVLKNDVLLSGYGQNSP